MIQASKDLQRTVENLETRDNIDTDRLAYFGLSRGAAEEHKRLVVLDGGHVPESANEFIREVLGWLDEYLGPVEATND